MFQPFPFFITFTEPELWFIAMALVLSVMDVLADGNVWEPGASWSTGIWQREGA